MAVTSIRESLQRDEGLRLKVYPDALGHPTIGYGRALDTNGITMAEADFLFENDLTRATAGVLARLPWSYALSEARRGVLINLCFNIGIGGLLGFRKMLAAMEAGDWHTAAMEMLDSTWAEQVGPRAHRLATQVLTDQWT